MELQNLAILLGPVPPRGVETAALTARTSPLSGGPQRVV